MIARCAGLSLNSIGPARFPERRGVALRNSVCSAPTGSAIPHLKRALLTVVSIPRCFPFFSGKEEDTVGYGSNRDFGMGIAYLGSAHAASRGGLAGQGGPDSSNRMFTYLSRPPAYARD